MIPFYHGKRGAKSKARVCKELEHGRVQKAGWKPPSWLGWAGRGAFLLRWPSVTQHYTRKTLRVKAARYFRGFHLKKRH